MPALADTSLPKGGLSRHPHLPSGSKDSKPNYAHSAAVSKPRKLVSKCATFSPSVSLLRHVLMTLLGGRWTTG